MERNATPEGRTVDDHQFVRPDENTRIPSQLTNNSPIVPASLAGNFRYIPEDSCDSILSFDDQDDDDDDDSLELSSKSLQSSSQAGRPYQGILSGRISKSQEPSAVEELQALMQSVREESGAKEKTENVPDGGCENSETSSMEVDYQRATVPNLEMVEQPEESYRARYESEGCRGPIRGVSENGFPTVKVNGFTGNVVMTVFLVTESGEPHLHSITGPGSTKTPCKEVTLKDNINGIQTLIGPEQNMTAVWDSLSVCRSRNWDADKKLRERGEDPAAWKNKKKEARLMFQCTIPQTAGRPGYILTCQSRPFLCTAPFRNPEIWWMSEKDSFAQGGKEAAIVGKAFSAGFRVRFYGNDSEGAWETLAEIDKSKSHQGAIVFKIPPYKTTTIDKAVKVYVEVRVGPEKDKRCSESIPFQYIPENDGDQPAIKSCSQCNSIKSALSHLFENDSKEVKTESDLDDSSQRSCLEPESKRKLISESMEDISCQEPSQNKQQLDERSRIIEQIKSLQSLKNIPVAEATKQNTRPLVDDVMDENNEKKLKTSFTDYVQTLHHGLSQTVSLAADYPKSAGVILQNEAPPGSSMMSSSASAGSFFTVPSNITQSPKQTSQIITSYQISGAAQTNTYTGPVNLQQASGITLLPANLPSSSQQPVRFCVVDNQQQHPVIRAYAPVQAVHTIQQIPNVQSIQHAQPVNTPMQINSSNPLQLPMHSFPSQTNRSLIQVLPAQYIQQAPLNQPSQQSSNIQLSGNGNLLKLSPNLQSSVGTSKNTEFVVLSNRGVISAVERVKQEPVNVRPQCGISQTSSTAPQINSVWSLGGQVSRPVAQILSSVPVQQTFVNQSVISNSLMSGSGAMSQISQWPILSTNIPQSSTCLSTNNSMGQVMIQGQQVQSASQQVQIVPQQVQAAPQQVQAAPQLAQPIVENVLPSSEQIQVAQQQAQAVQQQTFSGLQQMQAFPQQVQVALQQIRATPQQSQVAQQQFPSTSQPLASNIALTIQNMFSSSNNAASINSYINMATAQPASNVSAAVVQPYSFVSGSYAVSPAQPMRSVCQTATGLSKQPACSNIDRSAMLSNATSIIHPTAASQHIVSSISSPSFQSFVPSGPVQEEAQQIAVTASEVRKNSWQAQPINVEVTTNNVNQSTPLVSPSSFGLVQQLNNSHLNPNNQEHFSSNPSGSINENTGESGSSNNASFDMINYPSASQAFQFTQTSVASAMREIPSDSSMQVETPECWTPVDHSRTGTPDPVQNPEEPGKILSSGLAQDLNRLSVVGSQFQPISIQSEPMSIPSNNRQYPDLSERTASSYCDPQPMSLTEDPIPQELMNKNRVKEQPADIQSEFRSQDAGSESKFMRDTIQNEGQFDKQSVLLVSEQQQLADSFFVPQKETAENIHCTQISEVQSHDQTGSLNNDQPLIGQYMSQYDQLRNLTEQSVAGDYRDDFNGNKDIDNSFGGSQLNNQIQSSNESFSGSSTYQQSFQTADSGLLGSQSNVHSNIDSNAIFSQGNTANNLPSDSSEMWNQQTAGLNNRQFESEITSAWNLDSNTIVTSDSRIGQTSEMSFASASVAPQMGASFITDTQSNSMDVTETFHVQNIQPEGNNSQQQQLLQSENKQQLYLNDPFMNSHQTDQQFKSTDTQFSLGNSQKIESQQTPLHVEASQNATDQNQQFLSNVQLGSISQPLFQENSFQVVASQQQQHQTINTSSLPSFEPQFQATDFQSMQQQQNQGGSLQIQQQQRFEQTNAHVENQQLNFVHNVDNQSAVRNMSDVSQAPSDNQSSMCSTDVYAQQINSGFGTESKEQGRPSSDIPFTIAQTKQTEWNELIEDTKRLLVEGSLNQKEAQTIFSCVQQEDNLLLEMYRTSKIGADDKGKVIETLKHWVLNVKHVSA